MQPRVTAVLVVRRGGDALDHTLTALTHQTRRADQLVIVDAADDAAVTAQLADAAPTHYVTAPNASAGFGQLVMAGTDQVPLAEQTTSPYGGVDEWFWMLRHDTAPDLRALERLLGAVEVAPSVAVAGPKVMDGEHPTTIREFGETLTRTGSSVALAERELDQAQHDRTSDVLAVGEAGILVRRTVWRDVGGFDPALAHVDTALDLCVRIRLAGHRVVGVPMARVFAHESSAEFSKPGRVPRVSARTAARWRRTAQLHRRLVYAPVAAVPLHWLSLVPLALARSIGHLLAKRPTLVLGELLAALAVAFSGPAVPRARRRLARAREVGWAAIEPLRLDPREVRRRRAIARDARLGQAEMSRIDRPDFAPGGVAAVAGAAIVGLVATAPLLGAAALGGGTLAPLATDIGALADGVRVTTEGAADPFAFVLAALAALTAWQPSLALVVLWAVALPLAALGAWWAAAPLVKRPGPAAAVAVLWAAAPALAVALTEARLSALIVHLVLPWLVAAAVRLPSSWSATAVTGLLTAVLVAAAPSIAPALALVWVAAMVVRPRTIGRLLTLAVPVGVLAAPLIADRVLRGELLALLTDPGLAAAPGPASPTGILLGWPDLAPVLGPLATFLPADPSPLLIALVVGIPVVAIPVLGLLAPALPNGMRALAPLGLAALGLVTAIVASGIALTTADGRAVGLDVGPAVSLYWFGLVLAAGIGLDRLGRAGAIPGIVAVTGATAIAVPALAAVLLGSAAVAPLAEPRTLPALVAADASDDPRLGTLVFTPRQEGLAARIDRGAGPTLIDQRTIRRADDAELQALATLAGNLAAPSGRALERDLDSRDVRYVLLRASSAVIEGDDGADERAYRIGDVAAALDATPVLVPVGDTDAGRLWRVAADDDDRAAGPEPHPLAGTVLAVQLGVLALTVLLAVPTSIRPRRERSADGTIDDPAATFDEDTDD
ncbi:GT2 family glycosyltransferase [Microcella alkaliphila]|uniref:GT2 family glycosyltransferase n=1 Tax=Microcella alkaliphila TaxID=279828 RepID=A0A4V2FMK2_9MICO|nr:glycosyltransferase [Microcella alkaliphila]RZT58069.1 GT2 family glycosyltransferase [Microcella alkaliphila]